MLQVVIIGAGLGGLACAVGCRQKGLEVVVLERVSEISSIGAGIVIPPNGERSMKHLGLLDNLKLKSVGLDSLDLRRYEDGSLLARRHVGSQKQIEIYGGQWWVIHREDYHRVLLDAAIASGVVIKLGSSVCDLDVKGSMVELESGEKIYGDVIIGADGLWSTTREKILGRPCRPTETGDLAYRATFAGSQLRQLQDPALNALLDAKATNSWWGPDKHCVLYPVRGGTSYNLVLLRPDNLPPGVSKSTGDLQEMRDTFEDWDPILKKIISCIPNVLKWRLCHCEELESWCQNTTAILGDACHPTLPYQAQGAAMAVEDGVIISYLLGRLVRDFQPEIARTKVPSVLKLYERLRKPRTTLNVQGAIANRNMYHLHDGPEQQQRDRDIKDADFTAPSPWKFVDGPYQKELLGFDAIKEAEETYNTWGQNEANMVI